jgi:hypothetical protein
MATTTQTSTAIATGPQAFGWAACGKCGHKLCKAAPGHRVATTADRGTWIEILCRGCKTLNYIGARP